MRLKNDLRVAIAAALAVSVVISPAAQPLGFTTSVSARLIAQLVTRFGSTAREHIARWQAFPRSLRTRPSDANVSLVSLNRFFNRLPFVDDRTHWGVEDYWATPAEMVSSNGGDCEDFVISKYFMAKELGIPATRLRMTYVTSSRLAQPHMVLAYYPSADADPLILDNLEDTVRPASQRTDLTPVYSFNDEELWVSQRGEVGNPGQIRKWRTLLEALQREART